MLKTLQRWVDSLFLGTWHLPDGRVFECTPADRDYYFTRSKEFFTRGVPLPVCLEHQSTVGLSHEDRLAEQTRNTIGHCHDVRIGDEGQLQFLVDGTEADLTIMAKNKFTSPEIRSNVRDTRTGQVFTGPSIVHLASTPRPVQVTGKPHFQLSQSKPISLSAADVTVSLSQAMLAPPLSLGTRKPFDKDKHPRTAKGSKGGGRFAKKAGESHVDRVVAAYDRAATMGDEEHVAHMESLPELSAKDAAKAWQRMGGKGQATKKQIEQRIGNRRGAAAKMAMINVKGEEDFLEKRRAQKAPTPAEEIAVADPDELTAEDLAVEHEIKATKVPGMTPDQDAEAEIYGATPASDVTVTMADLDEKPKDPLDNPTLNAMEDDWRHEDMDARIAAAKENPEVVAQVADVAKKLDKPEEPLWHWIAKTAVKSGLTVGVLAAYVAAAVTLGPIGMIAGGNTAGEIFDAIWDEDDPKKRKNAKLSMGARTPFHGEQHPRIARGKIGGGRFRKGGDDVPIAVRQDREIADTVATAAKTLNASEDHIWKWLARTSEEREEPIGDLAARMLADAANPKMAGKDSLALEMMADIGTKLSGTCTMSNCDSASKKAMDSSAAAYQASSEAHDSPKASDHNSAAEAHVQAAQDHRGAQEAHESEGNSDQASHHNDQAKMHEQNAKLHRTKASISMSAAKPPKPPKADDDDAGDDTNPAPDADDTAPDADTGPSDLEEAGDTGDISDPSEMNPTVTMADLDQDDDGKITSDEARAAAVMKELEADIASLGPTLHASAHDDPISFMEHLSTAIKTYKASGGEGKKPGENDNQQDDNNQQDGNSNPQNPEMEQAEPQPIMMSNTNLETVLAKKVLKDSLAGLTPRIEALHKSGWIDDANKKDLLSRLGTVKLSMADIDRESGNVKPNTVEIEIAAIERLAKSGKAGPFAKPGKPIQAYNPNKPISTAVSLSTDNEQAVPAPYPADEDSPEAARKRGEAAGDELARMAGCSTN